MEPAGIYLLVKAAFGAGKTFAAADAQVAAAAREHGVSKKEAHGLPLAQRRGGATTSPCNPCSGERMLSGLP